MTSPNDPAIRSGAARVEEAEHLAAGLSVPLGSQDEVDVNEFTTQTPEPELADLTLSMFTQGSSTRVRVGNSRNASELYEHAFNSVDEANNAMLDNGILTSDQVPAPSKPAGTCIAVTGLTVEQLEAAGLKRRGTSTL